MGETMSAVNTNILDKIQLFQQFQDPFFGKTDIYRFKEPPYQYLMDHKKNYIDDLSKLNRQLNQINQLKNIEHPNLAKIYHAQIQQQVQLCIKNQKLHTYTNYYNFTLAQAIKKKKMTKYYFTQADLLYIANSLLGVAVELKKYGISKANYRCQEVFLSPEGYVKIFLLQYDEQNRHSSYYTVLSQKQRLSQFLLSPEQLASLRNLELQTKFDQYRADVFAIGLILVQLITLDQAKFYYNYDHLEVMIGKILFILESFAERYSPQFLSFMRSILQVDPNQRLNIQNAFASVANLIKTNGKSSHCIRLEADQNQNADKLTEAPKGRKIMLSTLNNSKLAPKPISMISSVNSSNNIVGSTRTNSYRNSGRIPNNQGQK